MYSMTDTVTDTEYLANDLVEVEDILNELFPVREASFREGVDLLIEALYAKHYRADLEEYLGLRIKEI